MVDTGSYERRWCTFMAFSGPSLEYILTRLTQTLEPSSVPSKISPEPPEATGRPPILRTEGERVYEDGSIVLAPHTCLSSRKHFRKAGLAGSRLLRVYACLGAAGEGNTTTYLIQVVDQPHQIIALKVPDALLKPFPIKDVAELIVELS